MSGHSKWATTKRQKSAVDAKRAKVFTKISKAISVAAREGADSSMNAKLRLAIDQAKAVRMPKENIDRAISRGAGLSNDGAQLESITYEAFGPGGVAIIIEVITDNKNRTAASLKHIFSKYGGGIGGSGSATWQFNRRGVIYWPAEINDDSLGSYQLSADQEMALIDAGVIDIKNHPGQTIIYTAVEDLDKVHSLANQLGLTNISASLEWVPKNLVKPANDEQITKLLEELDDDDDINDIYTNADI